MSRPDELRPGIREFELLDTAVLASGLSAVRLVLGHPCCCRPSRPHDVNEHLPGHVRCDGIRAPARPGPECSIHGVAAQLIPVPVSTGPTPRLARINLTRSASASAPTAVIVCGCRVSARGRTFYATATTAPSGGAAGIGSRVGTPSTTAATAATAECEIGARCLLVPSGEGRGQTYWLKLHRRWRGHACRANIPRL